MSQQKSSSLISDCVQTASPDPFPGIRIDFRKSGEQKKNPHKM